MNILIRTLGENELANADLIYRLAFGTQAGVPEPSTYTNDYEYIKTRWAADPTGSLGAELDGVLIGSNYVTDWGTVGLFGPLAVHPDHWNCGTAHRLLEATNDLFNKRGVGHAGLFAPSDSPKHLHLYQSFGFWPRFLTAIMVKSVSSTDTVSNWSKFSEVPESDRASVLSECNNLANSVFEGLNVESEVRVIQGLKLGDTVLVWGKHGLSAFAACHRGPGTEAGIGTCYVKFGAVRPGPSAPETMEVLLNACEALAAEHGMQRLVAGTNTARTSVYRGMLASGFKIQSLGTALHRNEEVGYNRPDVYVIDDWR